MGTQRLLSVEEMHKFSNELLTKLAVQHGFELVKGRVPDRFPWLRGSKKVLTKYHQIMNKKKEAQEILQLKQAIKEMKEKLGVKRVKRDVQYLYHDPTFIRTFHGDRETTSKKVNLGSMVLVNHSQPNDDEVLIKYSEWGPYNTKVIKKSEFKSWSKKWICISREDFWPQPTQKRRLEETLQKLKMIEYRIKYPNSRSYLLFG